MLPGWIKFVAALTFCCGRVLSDPIDHWTPRYPPALDPFLAAAAFGQGRFVAVGQAGAIFTSTDGSEWSRQPSLSTRFLYDIAYGKDRFVAVGNSGIVAQTRDAIYWNTAPRHEEDLNAIIFAQDKFVAVGDKGAVLVSEDGEDWRHVRVDTDDDLNAVTFGNGLFVAGGRGTNIFVSSDALNWTATPSTKPDRVPILDLCFGLGTFIAVTGRWGDFHTPDYILISTNGTNWADRALHRESFDFGKLGPRFISSCASGDGKLVLLGAGTLISTNGQDWSLAQKDHGSYQIEFLDDRFLSVGYNGSIGLSSNAVNWEWKRLGPVVPESTLNAIVAGNGLVLALPQWGEPLLSTDGTLWTNRAELATALGKNSGLPFSNTVAAATIANGTFYVLSYSGIYASTNGIDWTQRHSFSHPDYPAKIDYLNGRLIVVGADQTAGTSKSLVVTSSDGFTWTNRQVGGNWHLYGISYGNGRFVAVGSTLATSLDGEHWDFQPFPGTNFVTDVVFGNGIFVGVGVSSLGDTGVVQTSTNGLDWSAPILLPGTPLGLVRFAHGRFVAAGNGQFLSSPDGVNWTVHQKITSGEIRDFAFTGRDLVAVGSQHAIWTSGDLTRPWMTNVRAGIGGTLSLKLYLPPGPFYELQSSTDLFNWRALERLASGNYSASYTATIPSAATQGFYRILTLP